MASASAKPARQKKPIEPVPFSPRSVRPCQPSIQSIQRGPVPLRRVKELLEGSFGDELQKGLEFLDTQRDAEVELAVLDEQIHLLKRLEPLNMDLELLSGSGRVEVYVAETKKSSKAAGVFGSLLSKVELASAPGIVAVACLPSEGAEVQMALGELGGKPVQIPNLEGSPTAALKSPRQAKRG
jgi:vacuolar-type H+-ATPase subunit I/STV1